MVEQKVLVTGGAGYVGSHACKALKQAGFIPVTFDNLVTGWQDAVKFGPFERGDLLNKADVDRAFKEHAPVAVMHFAALSQVGESMQEPGLYWQNNVMGSLNLIEAAVEHDCMDFVFLSTCATYGDQDSVVLDEHSTQHPINAYGASKRAVEKYFGRFWCSLWIEFGYFPVFQRGWGRSLWRGWRISLTRNASDPVDFGCDRRKTGCADHLWNRL